MSDLIQVTVLIPKFLIRILQRKSSAANQDDPRSDINNLVNEYLWKGVLNDIKPVDLSNRRVREGEEIIPYDMPE